MNTEPKRYQCRHIFTDGHRCGSPCLRGEPFCYYHHTTRKPAPRQTPTDAFQLPLPEDRSAIQSAIGTILQRIAANTLDPKRAGLLLYGLQIASLNLPKQPELKTVEDITVEEVILDEQLGILAPEAELTQDGRTARERSLAELFMDELEREPAEEEIAEEELDRIHHNPIVLPELQAVACASPQIAGCPIHGAVSPRHGWGCKPPTRHPAKSPGHNQRFNRRVPHSWRSFIAT